MKADRADALRSYAIGIASVAAWPLLVRFENVFPVVVTFSELPVLRTWSLLLTSWWLSRSLVFVCFERALDRKLMQVHGRYWSYRSGSRLSVEAMLSLFAFWGTVIASAVCFGVHAALATLLGFAVTVLVATLIGCSVAPVVGRYTAARMPFVP